MDVRKKAILAAVVEEYTKTAEPVGSAFLAGSRNFRVSSATLRNEMMELEEGGYLTHPHTSAGRIPTEEGYRYYVNHISAVALLSGAEKHLLEQVISQIDFNEPESLKALAKTLAELANTAVIVAFRRHDVYCTGLTRFLAQPELRETTILVHIGAAIDHIDEVMSSLYDEVCSDVLVRIGKENPFAEMCGVVMSRLPVPAGRSSVFGFLGPMRMDYGHNIALLKSLLSLLVPPSTF